MSQHIQSIGIDLKIKTIEVDGKRIKLQLLDSAGQERFRTFPKTYFKGSHGIIVTYNISDRKSFSLIENWMNEIKKNASDKISSFLVGHQSDISAARQISTEEGKKLADHFNVRFMETSTKDNVKEAFIELTREIMSKVGSSSHNQSSIEY